MKIEDTDIIAAARGLHIAEYQHNLRQVSIQETYGVIATLYGLPNPIARAMAMILYANAQAILADTCLMVL
jgi:hypothetical protein